MPGFLHNQKEVRRNNPVNREKDRITVDESDFYSTSNVEKLFRFLRNCDKLIDSLSLSNGLKIVRN